MKAERGNGKKLPLCKGAEGTGETDCHDQFANWSRNDTVYKKCGTRPGSRADIGIVPYGELQGVRYKAGRRAEGSPPYKFDFVRGDGRGRTPPLRITRGAVEWADVGIGPYGCIIISAVVGRRPQGPALRNGL